LFQTDPDKEFFGRLWQQLKRVTWQLPNTIAGNLVSHTINLTSNVERVDYFHGSTAVYREGESNGAFSLGGYINMTSEDINGNPRSTNYGNSLFIHEYGHYLQEQAVGPLSIFSGINSALSSNFGWRSTSTHQETWYEADANARSLRYFTKKDAFNNWVNDRNETAEVLFRREFDDIKSGSWRWFLYLIPPVGIAYYIHNSNP
jgi:hypothetical protein